MRLLTGSILALLVVATPLMAAPPGDAKWKEAEQAFKQDFKKKSIRYKRMAIDGLPLDDERTIQFIIKKEKLLNHKDWWVRATAAERLSKIKTSRLRKILHGYAADSDTRVREGILAALAMSRDKTDPPIIVKALKDKAWEVRRMACWAAGQQRIREAVEPMIDMINDVDHKGKVIQEGEPHPRVHSVLLFNLEEITGKYFHTDTQQWRLYWDQNKDRTLPPVKRFDVGSFGDIKLKFNETFARKGSGPLVVCLPMTQKATTYYMPYFNQWMFVKWLFINLPPIESFPDVEKNEHGDPIYPVDILVDAFEDMRVKRKVEKMVLLAHGFSTWVAAKYAQKYPDRVSGLILLNPYASNETYGRRIDEAMRSGNRDDEFWAKVSSYQIKIGSQIEGEIYDYVRSSTYVHNKSEIELGMLRRVWRDPGATSIAIPPFDIRGEESTKVPTLMFFSPKKNKLTGYDDIKRLTGYYRKFLLVKLRKSARLPFMEEPEKFEEALRAFLDKYNIR